MKPFSLLHEIGKHCDRIQPRLAEALTNLETWAGIGYSSGGSGNGRGSDTSNPTAQAALAALERRARGQARDTFARDHAQIVEDLTTAEAALKRVEATIDRSRALPTDEQGKPVLEAAPGCEPCAQVKGTDSRPHESSWQQVYTRIQVKDRPVRMAVCSWHCDWYERYEEAPSLVIERWHLDHLGTRIPRQMVQDNHPDAWSRAQSKARGRLLGRTNLDLGVEAG